MDAQNEMGEIKRLKLKVKNGVGDARLEADSRDALASDRGSRIQAALWQTSSSSALNALRH